MSQSGGWAVDSPRQAVRKSESMAAFYLSPNDCRLPSWKGVGNIEVMLEVMWLFARISGCRAFSTDPATVVLADHANAGVVSAQAPVRIESGCRVLGRMFRGFEFGGHVGFIGVAGGRILSGRTFGATSARPADCALAIVTDDADAAAIGTQLAPRDEGRIVVAFRCHARDLFGPGLGRCSCPCRLQIIS